LNSVGDLSVDRRRTRDRPAAGELTRQRAITERLLLAALNARDATSEAITASRRATFLASASRELAMSLDNAGVREAIRRCTLLREGSWCIVDIVELDGAIQRLPVAHPDTAKQSHAEHFAERWFPIQARVPADVTPALIVDANATIGLEAVRALGFGGLLVTPLVVRGAELGVITFVTRHGDPPFSPQEVILASDLADLCALALDNERLLRQARDLRVVADAANDAKSAFVGNLSHELLTPLNAIGGYVALLEMGLRGPVSAEQAVDLARIRHNQTHLLALISNMLHFVREHGRLEYQFAEVSVRSALHEVTDMLQGAADERRLSLVCRADAVDDVAWADAERLRQILLNLVMNAVKYAGAGTGEILLSASSRPHVVAIHVTDNGPGMPEDKLQTIFDPFVQLSDGLSDRRGGVGLGLAISRDLARAMGGELSVESTLGVGSRFTLALPRARRSG
jgi:signal transduction histidine kinase